MARRVLPVASVTHPSALPAPALAPALAHRARVAVLALVAAAAPAAGCVEAFDGSNVQIDFAAGVHTSTRPGANPLPDQPPQDTHYELYAADVVYRTDPDGGPVLDDHGDPIIDRAYLFEVTRFAIRPAIDRGSPCLIELDDTPFPGLHVTQFYEQVKLANGADDPFEPGLPSDVVSDLLNARRRVENLEKIETVLKAVVSFEPFRSPATAPEGQCPPAAADALPHPGCMDPASNAQRLRLCRELWAGHPDYYEGSDKVFTLPLNGHYLGMVEGMNPLNMGFVGGSSMFVESNLVDHDAYVLNWQYDDLDGDGTPDFPADLPVPQRSRTGFLYMQGAPVEIARGVITVPLRHPTNASINADLAILPNLGQDDVHF